MDSRPGCRDPQTIHPRRRYHGSAALNARNQMMQSSSVFNLMRSLNFLDWKTLLLGWVRGWISKSDISNYAINWMSSSNNYNNNFILLLSGADGLCDNSIRDTLVQLAGEAQNDCSLELDKWRLAHLVDLKNQDLDWDTKVSRLEVLRTEFGYPEDMRLCTRYGPSQYAIEAGFASGDELLIDPLDAMDVIIAKLTEQTGTKGTF